MAVQPQHFAFTSSDQQPLHTYYWPAKQSRALVYLIHGMSEHGARYEAFAEYLNLQGISVVVPDQRGFGKSIIAGQYGHFSDKDGWSKLLDDHDALWQQLPSDLTTTPKIILGHSMGSYIAQHVIQRHLEAKGLVISGSGRSPRALLHFARAFAGLEKIRQGKRGYSKALDKLSFGSFNNAFKPNRTAFDWLSRDSAQVDRYVNDPLCGGLCTNQFWLDFLQGMLDLTQSHLTKTPQDLPILITGGADDPASGQKGLSNVQKAYIESGHTEVTLKIYSEGRHEMLNEVNRNEVFTDIGRWVNELLNQT